MRRQVGVEAHPDIAHQQPADRRQREATFGHLHQAVLDERLQRRQFACEVVLEAHRPGAVHFGEIDLGAAHDGLEHRAAQPAILTAFSTSSSSATLPTTLKVAEESLGVPRRVGRFVCTLGTTANMNGTALFEGVTVLFLAQFFGVDLSLGGQVTVVLLSILAGVGTAGVPGGSLPLVSSSAERALVQRQIEAAHRIGAEVIGVSTDSHFTHLAWLKTKREDGGLGKINYPLIADISKKMSADYGVLVDEIGDPMRGAALRGMFILDKEQKIRSV